MNCHFSKDISNRPFAELEEVCIVDQEIMAVKGDSAISAVDGHVGDS